MSRPLPWWRALLPVLWLVLVPSLAVADGSLPNMAGRSPLDTHDGLLSYPMVPALLLGALQIVIIVAAIGVAVFPPRATPVERQSPPEKG